MRVLPSSKGDMDHWHDWRSFLAFRPARRADVFRAHEPSSDVFDGAIETEWVCPSHCVLHSTLVQDLPTVDVLCALYILLVAMDARRREMDRRRSMD